MAQTPVDWLGWGISKIVRPWKGGDSPTRSLSGSQSGPTVGGGPLDPCGSPDLTTSRSYHRTRAKKDCRKAPCSSVQNLFNSVDSLAASCEITSLCPFFFPFNHSSPPDAGRLVATGLRDMHAAAAAAAAAAEEPRLAERAKLFAPDLLACLIFGGLGQPCIGCCNIISKGDNPADGPFFCSEFLINGSPLHSETLLPCCKEG